MARPASRLTISKSSASGRPFSNLLLALPDPARDDEAGDHVALHRGNDGEYRTPARAQHRPRRSGIQCAANAISENA